MTQGTLGYATKDSHGKLKLERFKESLAESEVEISDDVFILKAEDAQKLLEPPRLAQLVVRPEQVTLKPGEQASFSLTAHDQYGHAFTTPEVSWTAKGGTVTDDGVFTPGERVGRYTVHATTGGLEAIAEVSIAKEHASANAPRTRHPLVGRDPGSEVDEFLHQSPQPLCRFEGAHATSQF